MLFSNKGILGINARNLLYIRPYNSKKAIKLADDKIKTKQFLSAREIPVPKLYGIIKENAEIDKFDFGILPSSFVLKPNQGFGGEGIIVVTEKKDGYYISAGGKKFSKEDLKDHIRDIIDGRFSISNVSDWAFFEQYIVADERVGKYSYEGLPDIRVVVHNLIPVMAMLRLPTKESQGKANLHMGAVGVGIDIAKGEATHISYKNRIIEELPENLGRVRGLKIPYWDEILTIASTVQLITNLGYMAVDICIDKNSGPVLLEINARAGLGVQIANLAPLRRRLERIEGIKVTTPTKGVRMAKDMFGNTVEKEIANISGKQIISTEENVEIIEKRKVFRLLAKVDTSKDVSIIDEESAEKQGLLDSSDYDDEKSTLKLKFVVKNKRIQTIVDVEKIAGEKYKMILGKRDLKDFLIDTNLERNSRKDKSRKQPTKEKYDRSNINFQTIDQQLLSIDTKLKLLYHLRPLNLDEEKAKFFSSSNYNPIFEYPALKFDPIELISELEKVTTNNSILGQMFQEKKEEIAKKIQLLESIDEERFSVISEELFGKPTAIDVENATSNIKNVYAKKEQEDRAIYNAEDAKKRFTEAFAKYNLKNWKVKIKESMVADCVAGKSNRLFVKQNAMFSRERIESLIVHEIETHILTAENGKKQPYENFNRGMANYLITQEGLAMYNVEKQRHAPFTENTKALAHVLAINQALHGSFRDVFQLLSDLGLSREQAFRSALKAKRGLIDTSKKGAFTKDYIYYKGYFEIKEFVENGGDIKDLYIGKINVHDIEKTKKIADLNAPVLLPTWL